MAKVDLPCGLQGETLPNGKVALIVKAGQAPLVFDNWKAASRAISKELRRIKREALFGKKSGTCPLDENLNPKYESHSKIRRDTSPKTYKTWTVTK